MIGISKSYVVGVCGESGHIDITLNEYVAVGSPTGSPGIPCNPVADPRSCVLSITDQGDAVIEDQGSCRIVRYRPSRIVKDSGSDKSYLLWRFQI